MPGRDHRARIAEVRAGSVPAKVAYPIGIRELEVLRTRRIGSGLVRLTLGGPDAAGFESHVPEEHVRLVLPDPDGTLRLPEREGTSLRWPRPLPVSREYTVRRHDPVAGEVDVDVALHPGGVASDWASAVAPGARIHVAGPPGGHVVPDGYERWIFGGDLTAAPQIARWLEHLPAAARGEAFLEVRDAAEEFEVRAPAGVEVTWVHRGDAPPGGDALERALRTVRPPAGERTYVWIAGEAGALKPLRRWVKHDLAVPAADCRIAGYWKRGVADYDED